MICPECGKKLTNEEDAYGHDCEVGIRPLPIYKIKGKFYFLDRKLGEYRNIKNPNDRIKFNSFPKLQKPTKKDRLRIFKK